LEIPKAFILYTNVLVTERICKAILIVGLVQTTVGLDQTTVGLDQTTVGLDQMTVGHD
jgi:hypothetical protein